MHNFVSFFVFATACRSSMRCSVSQIYTTTQLIAIKRMSGAIQFNNSVDLTRNYTQLCVVCVSGRSISITYCVWLVCPMYMRRARWASNLFFLFFLSSFLSIRSASSNHNYVACHFIYIFSLVFFNFISPQFNVFSHRKKQRIVERWPTSVATTITAYMLRFEWNYLIFIIARPTVCSSNDNYVRVQYSSSSNGGKGQRRQQKKLKFAIGKYWPCVWLWVKTVSAKGLTANICVSQKMYTTDQSVWPFAILVTPTQHHRPFSPCEWIKAMQISVQR